MKLLCLVATVFALVISVATVWSKVADTFSDGDFTNSPAWTGDVDSWAIMADSDVAAGASGTNTLRLSYGTSESGQQYLVTQRTGSWGVEQTWAFWLGRRNQAATASNYSVVWLWADNPNLVSPDVRGYRVRFGDNSDDDNIFLERLDGDSTSTPLIVSDGAVPNGITDIGFLVRVTRTSDSNWTLYTSALPSTGGDGLTAQAVPSVENTAIFQGAVNDSTFTGFDDGYWGVVAVHTSAENARDGAEFDQFHFSTSSDTSLPVTLSQFTATRTIDGVQLRWRTESEVNNLGFWIYRSDRRDGTFEKVNPTIIAGAGTSGASHTYTFLDAQVEEGVTYFYYLEDVAFDGSTSQSRLIQLGSPNGRRLVTWASLKDR